MTPQHENKGLCFDSQFSDLMKDPQLFKENYRMPYDKFMILHDLINEDLEPKPHSRPDSISIPSQSQSMSLAIACHFWVWMMGFLYTFNPISHSIGLTLTLSISLNFCWSDTSSSSFITAVGTGFFLGLPLLLLGPLREEYFASSYSSGLWVEMSFSKYLYLIKVFVFNKRICI